LTKRRLAPPAPPLVDIQAWAREVVGACDCAGGCWCDEYRAEAIRFRRAGLEAALHVVGGPSFITKKKIKDLIAEADRALKPT
jgi:hypothetical protein